MSTKFKFVFSIFLIWLFNISGIFGILSDDSEWFLQMTPLNLMLYLVFIAVNVEKINLKFFYAFLIPFFIGFITEFLGVNYGLIFGSYEYGENLGYKVGGVPVMICVNWAVLTFITADISKLVHKSIWIRSFIGGLLMMLLDLAIEVSAPRFDFWEFENEIVPIQNYVGWLVISFIAHLLFQRFEIKTNKQISIQIFIAISVFFLTFLFF
jgi:putative membrane protein